MATPSYIMCKIEKLRKLYSEVHAEGAFVIVKKSGYFGCLRFNVTTEKEPKGIALPFIYKSIQIYSGWFFILETDIGFSLIHLSPNYQILPYRTAFSNRKNLKIIKGYNNDELNQFGYASYTSEPIQYGQESCSNLLVEYEKSEVFTIDNKTGERIASYDSISYLYWNYYETIKGGLHGLINSCGTEILECKFDFLDYTSSGSIIAKMRGKRFYIDTQKYENLCEMPKVIALNISQSFHNWKDRESIYDCTRKYWKMSFDRAKQAEYCLAVLDYKVVKVYCPKNWTIAEDGDFKGRLMFEGNEVENSDLLGLDLSEKFYRRQNPICYLGVW